MKYVSLAIMLFVVFTSCNKKNELATESIILESTGTEATTSQQFVTVNVKFTKGVGLSSDLILSTDAKNKTASGKVGKFYELAEGRNEIAKLPHYIGTGYFYDGDNYNCVSYGTMVVGDDGVGIFTACSRNCPDVLQYCFNNGTVYAKIPFPKK
jgi:hypothetical protein